VGAFDAKATVRDVPFPRLKNYWPPDVAKGGRLWGNANNEDWDAAQAAEWRSASLWGLWSEVGAPWAAQG